MGLRRFAKRVGHKVERQVKASAKQIGGIVKGQMGLSSGGGGGGDSSTPNQGPQFTDEARRQAAGAGTVGFTQRTQNY